MSTNPEAGEITHRNPNLKNLNVDVLYHFDLTTEMDFKAMFGDVKYVCMGGSADRAREFALKAARQMNLPITDENLKPIGKTERYTIYKVGPIIFAAHGIGMPSISIMLHELTKALEYAQASDFKYIRVGTSGGLGVAPGTVVVTEEALNDDLRPYFEFSVLGHKRRWETKADIPLMNAILKAGEGFPMVRGKTFTANGFYDEQARMDGALDPDFTVEQRRAYFDALRADGVRNIEMEAAYLLGFCTEAGIPAAVVCAAILNRLKGDQVTSTSEELASYSDNPEQVVLNMIFHELAKDGDVWRFGEDLNQ